jgi:peptidyl-prolyl cis-trans isomerase C
MRLVWVVLGVGVVCGCNKPVSARVDFSRSRPPGTEGGAWVARWSGDTLTEPELKQRFAEMNPYARGRFQTVEQRREYVDGLVRFELLAQEAVRRGLAQDPEVVDQARRVMVQRLLKQELEERADALTDAQVAAYYEAHRADFVKPAMTRLSHVFFAKADRGEATEVMAEVKKLAPLDYTAFGKLARAHSKDPRTQPLDGDLRFLSDEELAAQTGPEVVTAAATLKQVGELFPELVETQAGFHIVKLQGRQVALNLSLEQARPSITSVLLNESKQERFRALLDRLKQQAGYALNEPVLAGITVDVKAPAVDAKGPQPGFLPAPPPPVPVK